MKLVSYLTLRPLKKLRNKDKPSCNAQPWSPDPGLQILFLTKRNQVFLGRKWIPSLWQEMYKMSLEHTVISEKQGNYQT